MLRLLWLPLIALATVMSGAAQSTVEFDDPYFPAEQAAEERSIVWPRLLEVRDRAAVLSKEGEPVREVSVGRRYLGLEVVAVLPGPEPMVVLERNFGRWGVFGYISKKGPVARIRKAVGAIEKVPPPREPFRPGYYDRVLRAQEDLLGRPVLASGKDPSYEAVADLLPPLDSYTFLGTMSSEKKIIVHPDGRLGLGRVKRTDPPEKVLFDPWEHAPSVRGLKARAAALPAKKGLVGGYLPVVDFAFYDPAGRSGFEEIAFATGNQPEVHVRVRTSDGTSKYWRVVSEAETADGSAFYADLLALHREWEGRLARGARIEAPETRVMETSKAAIVRGLISYVGSHPKYGVQAYWENVHDTFPPTTLLFNSLLLDWGFTEEARDRLGYYLSKFVKPDGTFDYYGPAVSEYGQMLALAARCARLGDGSTWMDTHLPAVERIGNRLLAQQARSRQEQSPESPAYGLIYGAAEADTSKDQAFYFSGDVWCWRGLVEMGQWMTERSGQRQDKQLGERGRKWLAQAALYREDILRALQRSLIAGTAETFVPPIAGSKHVFQRMTEDPVASYTNYRYWLEMLSPELLPARVRDEIIAYRTAHGGELLGTTRFEKHLDDWPYAHYAWGLLDADKVDHYLLGFYGHLAQHLTPGTLTSYEQVAIQGETTRSHVADYCVPVQIVTPQMLRWMLVWEPWSEDALWLARAAPSAWFAKGFAARGVPTRWGPVTFSVKPSGTGLQAELEMPGSHPREVRVRLRPLTPVSADRLKVVGTQDWKWDASLQILRLSGNWKRVSVTVR